MEVCDLTSAVLVLLCFDCWPTL